jgi:hypothetical protein
MLEKVLQDKDLLGEGLKDTGLRIEGYRLMDKGLLGKDLRSVCPGWSRYKEGGVG